jgi:hypothetical protein
MFGRRLQILLDEQRYRRLAARARETNKSVGALIRDAIDSMYPAPSARRTAALRTILEAPRLDLPSPRELRHELEEVRSGHR